MLVLSRKPGERIFVGPEITITVVRLGPNSVRIGIDAPGHLKVIREELVVESLDQIELSTLEPLDIEAH